MKTLTSMTDFVLEQRKIHQGDFEDYADLICRYALFLKQPLAIYQFVPCELVDEEWVVLEEPLNYKKWESKRLNTPYDLDLSKYEKYQEALDEVLFDGFEVCNRQSEFICLVFKDGYSLLKNLLKKPIEDLVPYNLSLTKTALKEIGL